MYKIEDILNKIHCADCIKFMREMPDNSIDTVITDPPYFLGFMGKKWDTPDKKQQGMYEFNFNWAKEALRVAKPGATLLCFGGTRTWHRLACALEDAGWIIKDTIMWIYGSGFPKSYNIPKGIDAKLRIGKCNPKGINKSELCKKTGKKVIRLQPNNGILGEKKEVLKKENTELITPEAKFWNGYGTALKPAYEPIIMAMKPNEGSYAENALKWGVSGLNIDEARIPCNQKANPHKQRNSGTLAGGGRTEEEKYGKSKFPEGKYSIDTPVGKIRSELRTADKNPNSRFPANIIFDTEAARELDRQSGVRKGWSSQKHNSFNPYGGNALQKSNTKRSGYYEGFNDTGGASRFFYVAKANRAERNMGCENMEEKIDCDRNPKLNSANVPMNRSNNPKQNIHPTVKPLKLMEYLCILTRTPTGGIILDPFAGSGTTCMAAKKIGRDFIGIEREADYCAIARARIKAIKPNLTLFENENNRRT